jgi:hypothetical protein
LQREKDEMVKEELKLRRMFYKQRTKDALKVLEVKEEPKQRSSGGGHRKRKRHHERKRQSDSDGFVNDGSDVDDKVRRKQKAKVSQSWELNNITNIIGIGSEERS